MYTKVLEDIYDDSPCAIKSHKKNNNFPIKQGVKRGDTIPLKLFTTCSLEAFKELELGILGIKVDGKYFSLRFADDIV